jgi:hypothetical protein
MSAARRLLLLLSTAAALFAPASQVSAQPVVWQEYYVKAGVIGVLPKFATWPPGDAPAPGKPLVIGILGQDPFVENGVNQLELAVAKANAGGTNIVVKRFPSAKNYEASHILFVSHAAEAESDERTLDARWEAAKKLTAGKSVLVVGESDGLAKKGVVANLVVDPVTNLIQLEINPDAAGRAGLKLQPQLLSLKIVKIVRDPKN